MELAVRRQEEQYQGPGKALQRPEQQEEAGDVWLMVEAEKPQVPAPGTLQAGITISGAGALGLCLDNCHLAEDPETGESSRKTPSQERRRNPKEN